MTESEFKQKIKRTETRAAVTYDIRPFEEKQQEAVAWYIGSLVNRLSLNALNTSKVLTLLVDSRFESTAQLDGFVEKLKGAGLFIQTKKDDTLTQQQV